jgi:hypothetical protein
MRTELSKVGPRNVKPLALIAAGMTGQAAMDAIEAAVPDLNLIGLGFSERQLQKMAGLHSGSAMDALEPTITTPNAGTPVQYLQQWLPGFVRMITAARKIDELIGISIGGKWEDEEVVQGVLELTGTSVPYGDLTNIPFSSWNANYERRTVIRFEEGLQVGVLEQKRAAAAGIDSAAEKRAAAAMALEIRRNSVGFYGYNNGANRTYGILNDPNLPAYSNLPTGSWATATWLQIIADIRSMFAALRAQSGDTIDPDTANVTLAIASEKVDYLGVTSEYGQSVREWLRQTYPNARVVSVPEFNNANGGADVAYLFAETVEDGSTDDNRTIIQVVQVKAQLLGVDQGAKTYVEDYTNATGGVMVKRPYAIVRRSGL